MKSMVDVRDATVIEKILDLHKPWTYQFRLGSIEFCSHCLDATGKTYVSYPCATVKIVLGNKDN